MTKAPLAILSVLALLAGAAQADAAEREVSADAVEFRPGLGSHAGRLYVRGNNRRYEHQVMGLPVVEIDLPEQGIRRVLYPLTRSYMEQSLASLPKEIAAALAPPVDAPCKETQRLACKRSGEAEIGGIKTEVWTLRPAGAPADSTIHWDPARRLALREAHVDGRTLEATRLGTERYESLDVERWRITYAYPGGMRLEGQALVSPDLGMTIAERRPDGASRQLVNVTKGGVDASMFTVPAGYRRMTGPGDAPAMTAPDSGQATPSAPATPAPPAGQKPRGDAPATQPPAGEKASPASPEKKGAVTPLADPTTPPPGRPASAEAARPATSGADLAAMTEPKRRVEAALATQQTNSLPAGFSITDTLSETTVPVPARNPGSLAALDVPAPERKPASLAAPAAGPTAPRATVAPAKASARNAAPASTGKPNAANRGVKRRSNSTPTRNTKRRKAG